MNAEPPSPALAAAQTNNSPVNAIKIDSKSNRSSWSTVLNLKSSHSSTTPSRSRSRASEQQQSLSGSLTPTTASSASTSLDKTLFPSSTPIPSSQQSSRARVKMAASTLSLLSYLRIPIAATSAIAASLSGLLYWKQNEIIYPRNVPAGSRTEIPKPSDFPDYGISDYAEYMIPTPDGEKLHAYLLRPSNKSNAEDTNLTFLLFHGNAGNIGHRLPIGGMLDMHVPSNVLMVEYRGYGKSTGTPNEKGLNIDSQASLDWIRQNEELKSSNVIVYGQSLGGAVAVQLVARNQKAMDVKGLILENTFTSIRKLIPSAFPPARFIAHLCHQIWPSEETIPKITSVPILFLSGQLDEIVPASHMAKLHAASLTSQSSHARIFKLFTKGSHNNTVACPGYFQTIADFIEEHVVI